MPPSHESGKEGNGDIKYEKVRHRIEADSVDQESDVSILMGSLMTETSLNR